MKERVTILAKLREASTVLRLLGFDDERCNRRSAVTLLALLGLRATTPWASAQQPMLGTLAIMQWASTEYGMAYKPNTRETFRRRTLHQFAEAALVVQNPDQPSRPINSPKWCYQITPEALAVIRTFDGNSLDPSLTTSYMAENPALRQRYAAERDLIRVPVTFEGGTVVHLSPGGQNGLIKAIIEDFCSRFLPGGRVLYIGDSDAKWLHHAAGDLQALGVTVDSHGKMPDVVVHLPDRDWLVLIEAASSHGPVDFKRLGELRLLFQDATPGLVFVSCFPSRAEMRKHLAEIAWETEVWCADSATHLIHFNGERFLGPY